MRRTFSVLPGMGLCLLSLCVALLVSTNTARAQGTTFTYQGRLTDGGTPPTATYDMQFKLYDTATVGTGALQGSPNTVTRSTVSVTNGIFTVQLDFGASGFPGADRFLEINVRHPGDPSYTPLSPRQQLTSTPYAIQALTATNNVLKSGDTMSGTLRVPSLIFTPSAVDPFACTATTAGGLYYSSSSNGFKYCDGANWLPLGAGPIFVAGQQMQSQQQKLDQLQQQVKEQQAEIEGWKRLLCLQNLQAEICK